MGKVGRLAAFVITCLLLFGAGRFVIAEEEGGSPPSSSAPTTVVTAPQSGAVTTPSTERTSTSQVVATAPPTTNWEQIAPVRLSIPSVGIDVIGLDKKLGTAEFNPADGRLDWWFQEGVFSCYKETPLPCLLLGHVTNGDTFPALVDDPDQKGDPGVQPGDAVLMLYEDGSTCQWRVEPWAIDDPLFTPVNTAITQRPGEHWDAPASPAVFRPKGEGWDLLESMEKSLFLISSWDGTNRFEGGEWAGHRANGAIVQAAFVACKEAEGTPQE